ncbi:MAG: DUF4403 family protein [Microscillaceae bacterium]|nr:DUF4403 family protein [Microscillaceae bacterium]
MCFALCLIGLVGIPSSSQAQVSQLNIPIRLPWADLEKKVNTELKELIYQGSNFVQAGDNPFELQIWKIAPIRLKGAEEGLDSESALRIRVKGRYQTTVLGVKVSQSIDEELKIRVFLRTRLQIKPDWTLQSKSQLLRYEWIDNTYLEFGIIRIALNPILDRIIAQNESRLLAEVDRQISQSLDFRAQIRDAWTYFQTPVATSEWGADKTWLWFVPQEVWLHPIQYQAAHLEVPLAIQALSRGVLAQMPDAVSQVALPKAKLKEGDYQTGNQLWIEAYTPRTKAVEKAREIFTRSPYSFRNGRYQILVKDLDIQGEGVFFRLALDLEGTVTGRVYMSGRPVFDPVQKRLTVADFDYNTEEARVNVSGFVRWLFAKKIKNQIRLAFEEAMAEQVAAVRQEVEKSLAYYRLNEIAVMRGQVADFYFDQASLEDGLFKVRAYLGGQLEIHLQP